MKKLLAILVTTLMVLTLVAGCSSANSNASETANDQVPPPTPGPDSLVPSSAMFRENRSQTGEISLAPGETFAVSLAEYEEGYAWQEQPEIVNEGMVELVDHQSYQADSTSWQTWTFRAVDEGACLVHFQTQGHDYAVMEWSYTIAVAVLWTSVETFSVEFIEIGPTSEEISDEGDGWILNRQKHLTYDLSGDLEGVWEIDLTGQAYVPTGRFFTTMEQTFTGTVNGLSGTLVCLGFGWGCFTHGGTVGETSWHNQVWVIISGTGELAELQGTFHRELSATPVEPATDPPTYELAGPWSGTFWFLDQGQ